MKLEKVWNVTSQQNVFAECSILVCTSRQYKCILDYNTVINRCVLRGYGLDFNSSYVMIYIYMHVRKYVFKKI